jgi:hypothetical protein
MKEVLEALSPWPLVQGLVIGLVIAGIGVWAMVRGLRESSREGPALVAEVRVEKSDEEKRREWEAFRDLDHIAKNSFELVKLLEQMVTLQRALLEAMNRFNDSRWNRGQE